MKGLTILNKSNNIDFKDNNKELRDIKNLFDLQKRNYKPSNTPDYQMRLDRLDRLDKMIRNNIDQITKALQKDFGTRSAEWIFVAEIYPVLDHIKHVKKNLRKWMRKEKQFTGLLALTGQKEYIVNEPLGVVGIISPFNAPVSLALDPAIEALAAGNSVMVKISENTPITADLMRRLVKASFSETEMVFIIGGVNVSKYFSSLPWDKFFFTGGSEVGKRILESAANSLTPVILELGGKSPCVLLEDANVAEAAKKIGKVRLLNAGQVCISGDYVLLPENQLEQFIDEATKAVAEIYPNIIKNDNYTSICYQGSYDRIVSYIDEAKDAGCRIIQVNPMNENVPDPTTRKIPLTIVVNPPRDLMVSKHEIFGPILIIYTYKNIDEAIEEINGREKALALYIFGKKQLNINYVINNTSSGGITVNDLLIQANASSMGFGGVGYSGMGRYKGGFIGYQAFTNPKTVVEQGLMRRFTDMFMPPYNNERTRKMLKSQVGL